MLFSASYLQFSFGIEKNVNETTKNTTNKFVRFRTEHHIPLVAIDMVANYFSSNMMKKTKIICKFLMAQDKHSSACCSHFTCLSIVLVVSISDNNYDIFRTGILILMHVLMCDSSLQIQTFVNIYL